MRVAGSLFCLSMYTPAVRANDAKPLYELAQNPLGLFLPFPSSPTQLLTRKRLRVSVYYGRGPLFLSPSLEPTRLLVIWLPWGERRLITEWFQKRKTSTKCAVLTGCSGFSAYVYSITVVCELMYPRIQAHSTVAYLAFISSSSWRLRCPATFRLAYSGLVCYDASAITLLF